MTETPAPPLRRLWNYADEYRGRCGAVIGAARAVNGNCATEFGNDRDDSLRPGVTELFAQNAQAGIKTLQPPVVPWLA